MEGIVSTLITAIASIIVACIAAGLISKKKGRENLEELVDEVKVGLDNVSKTISEVSADNAENFIVTFIGEKERGMTHSDSETRRFWLNYRIYRDNGRNDYVHAAVEKLQAEGKI